MTYPEYYEAEKENEVVMDDDFALSEHLRFSTNTYRQSIDENSIALKKYNDYRYSEDSNGKRSSGSRSNRIDENSVSLKNCNDYRYSEDSNGMRSCASRSSRGNRESGGSSNEVNKPMQKERASTSTRDDRKHSSTTSKQDARNSEITNVEACEKTIALFGVSGVTGHYFLQLAVEAGYHVRALILPGFELEDMKENPSLTLVHGTMDDQAKIHRVIRKAAYVVCMLNDCPLTLDTIPPTLVATHSNYDFVQKLIPLMSRCANCKVLLYQASSFARDTQGPAPVISNVVKKMAVRKNRREMLNEQDKIVKFISKYQKAKASEESGNPFNYIITRPSEMVWDRPSRKKLEASKSLPGPFPITNVDLAEFSLNALKSEKLYNTCPYVVQDGI